jgi:hypothetical protein
MDAMKQLSRLNDTDMTRAEADPAEMKKATR